MKIYCSISDLLSTAYLNYSKSIFCPSWREEMITRCRARKAGGGGSSVHKDDQEEEVSSGTSKVVYSKKKRRNAYRTTTTSNNKRSSSTTTRIFPFDIIFKILLLIPVETLWEVMRFVSRQWNDIIHDPLFISQHLLSTPNGLLIQHLSILSNTRFLERRDFELKTKRDIFFDLSRLFHHQYARICGSCNGLLFFFHCRNFGVPATSDKGSFCLANPVTKELLKLPRSNTIPIPTLSSTLGYAASIEAYKVVSVPYATYGDFSCEILTVGVDQSWRFINTKSIGYSYLRLADPLDPIFLVTVAVYTKGFIYWATDICPTIRCLDVDTESFHFFCLPKGYVNKGNLFLPMGDFLAMVTYQKGRLKWEVRVVRQVTNGGEWTRLADIDLECHFTILNKHIDDWYLKPRPLGWLHGGEFLVIWVAIENTCIIQNVKTRESSLFQLDFSIACWPSCFPYVPSLVSIKP